MRYLDTAMFVTAVALSVLVTVLSIYIAVRFGGEPTSCWPPTNVCYLHDPKTIGP